MAADPQAEQKKVLGFPARPGGNAEDVRRGRHPWYEVAEEIHRAFEEIETAFDGAAWSGPAREAFRQMWREFSQHGALAQAHCRDVGDHLLIIGNRIDDAQHEWEAAMMGVAASTAVGIGLTVFTFGISDAVAEAAAAGAVAAMEGVCAALEMVLAGLAVVLEQAIRIGAQLAARFAVQFAINLVTQESSNLVQSRSPLHLDLQQAAEYAAVGTVLPEVATGVEVGGKAVLGSPVGSAAFDVAAAMAADAGVQGIEKLTEGKDLSLAEVISTGVLAAAGHGGVKLADAALRRDPMGLSGAPADNGPVSRTEVTMWQHRSVDYNAALDRSIDTKLKLLERGETATFGRNEAKRLLIRENTDPGDSTAVANAKIKDSLQRLRSMDSPLTVRMSRTGEHHFRYTDTQDEGTQLTVHGNFQTPEAARQALNLPSAHHGWLRQPVLTRRQVLVLDGHARGGTANHTLLVREHEVANLEFGKASRYGVSASAQEGAADMGRIAHDARMEASGPEGHTDMQSLRPEAQELSADAARLKIDTSRSVDDDRA